MAEPHDKALTAERIEQWLEGARDPQGHPGWHPETNGDIRALCELALKGLQSSFSAVSSIPIDMNMVLNAKEAERAGMERITISVPIKDILYASPFASSSVTDIERGWDFGQNVRGLLERLKLHFQRGNPDDARYSKLTAKETAAAFVADAERASRQGDLLYFEICTLLQRSSSAITPSRADPKALRLAVMYAGLIPGLQMVEDSNDLSLLGQAYLDAVGTTRKAEIEQRASASDRKDRT